MGRNRAALKPATTAASRYRPTRLLHNAAGILYHDGEPPIPSAAGAARLIEW